MPASLDDLTADTRDRADALLAYAQGIGLSPVVSSTGRTCAQQNALYAMGRTAPGSIVTHARGCVSWHVLGRAMDVALGSGSTADDYAKLGAHWKQSGGAWGGDFPGFADIGHFEYHPGVHIEQVCLDPANCTIAPYPGTAEPGSTPAVNPQTSGGNGAIIGLLAFVGTVALGWRWAQSRRR